MESLKPGMRIGPHELAAPIGAGGMGEVWKARDTRLDRTVAIKFSHSAFSDRFQREARAIAALNHPNIATLHDVGENYLVMEYVDGDPVRPPGDIPKLLDIAVQIADGLAAAHSAGLVHRDLKPDNILLTKQGRVKILDFGLAKQTGAPAQTEATMTAVTNPGTVMGTVSYMSPEQARGEDLDARSDQFSLGLILYELAAGTRAFQRQSAPETMAAIIRDEAEPLPLSVPTPLRWTIERCLAKEADHRYDSTRDLYRDLEQIRARLTEATQAIAAPSPARRNRGAWARFLPAAFGVIAGVALAWLLPPPMEADLSGYRFTPITRDEGQEVGPEWSPDGKSIAYLAGGQVHTKLVGASNATQITRQGGGFPFWSLDGTTIYFVLRNALWAAPASGGAPRMMHQPAAAAAVHPDGKTFAIWSDGELSVGPLEGGQRRSYALAGLLPKFAFVLLRFSPDGSRIALRGGPADSSWWVLPHPPGTPRRVASGTGSLGGWFPDNRHLLLVNSHDDYNSSLVVLDTATGRQQTMLRTAAFIVNASLSPDGRRIAYSTGFLSSNLVEVDVPSGRTSALLERGGASFDPDWAPSGAHYLFSSLTYGIAEIEDHSAGDGLARRIVSSASDGMPADVVNLAGPRWAPGGDRYLFVVRTADQAHRLYVATASGGRPDLLDRAAARSYSGAWSPDGEWIAYNRESDGKSQLVKVHGAGTAPVVIADSVPGLGIETGHFPVHWAKSGKWILFTAPDGVSIVTPDGAHRRTLSNRRFNIYGFAKQEDLIYGVLRDGQSRQWQLLSVNVASGAEKLLATLDLPSHAQSISGFSLHPDGRRFAISVTQRHRDIWMLEGFEPPRSFWERLWPWNH